MVFQTHFVVRFAARQELSGNFEACRPTKVPSKARIFVWQTSRSRLAGQHGLGAVPNARTSAQLVLQPRQRADFVSFGLRPDSLRRNQERPTVGRRNKLRKDPPDCQSRARHRKNSGTAANPQQGSRESSRRVSTV